ncbi:MAG: hypothetical protein FWG51_00370 [Firmicutes bacterium]|nr:hypothetical protein [Bacillota bacterium]
MKGNGTNGEKSLHTIAFWLLLIGGLAGLAYAVYDALMIIMIWTGITNFYGGVLSMVGSFTDLQGADTIVKICLYGIGGLILLAMLIFILIYLVFIIKLLRNKAKPTRQNYFRGVLIISFISAANAIFGLTGGNFVSIVGIVISAAIIAGYFIQKQYNSNSKIVESNNAK